VASVDKIGENLYNRGVYNSILMVEGARNAQKITGKKVINGDDMRRGMESLNITAARWKELGLEGFAAPMAVSCGDHNGHNPVFVSEWDGKKYVQATQPITPLKDIVRPLIEAAAKDYAEKNTGWPKRTEACDKAS
jgi:branched-chain amino acid transport system substrate-binding protein